MAGGTTLLAILLSSRCKLCCAVPAQLPHRLPHACPLPAHPPALPNAPLPLPTADVVWLNVVALSALDAFRDLPDSLARSDASWRAWYDAEAPEALPVPDFEMRLSKFERMCIVRWVCGWGCAWDCYGEDGLFSGTAHALLPPQPAIACGSTLMRRPPIDCLLTTTCCLPACLPAGRSARIAPSSPPQTTLPQPWGSATWTACRSTWNGRGRRAGPSAPSSACCRRVGGARAGDGGGQCWLGRLQDPCRNHRTCHCCHCCSKSNHCLWTLIRLLPPLPPFHVCGL